MRNTRISRLAIFGLLAALLAVVLRQAQAFVSPVPKSIKSNKAACIASCGVAPATLSSFSSCNPLFATEDDDETTTTDAGMMTVAQGDQLVLGSVGVFMSLVVFVSEYTLYTTGCGLPAGPFGLFGLTEGLSYLGVIGLTAYSLVTKVRTGSGLPAGPYGVLGAAEGLSFLTLLVGAVVLVLQVSNFGYIPNAVPMEGGMCS